MRDLYDIYENGGIVATPGNTMGMGNPMTPTDGENGTEPICPTVKCKKEKKGKKKKTIDESILGNTSDKVKRFSVKQAIAQWFAENQNIKSKDKTEEIAAIYEKQIIDNGDGTFDIDTTLNDQKKWSLDIIQIPKEGIPDWLKIRNVRLDFSVLNITSLTGDLRNFDWNISLGKTVAGVLDIKFWTTDVNISIGPVSCGEIRLISNNAKSIDFDPKINATSVNIKNCEKLEYVSNIPKTAVSVSLPRNVVNEYLKNKGFVPKGATIYIG
jgi:hypothetical protein